MPRLVVAVLALALSGLSAYAEDLAATVASGKRTRIGNFGVYNTFACESAGAPDTRITRQPANGRLEVVMERNTIDAGRCGTIIVTGPSIYYTSKRGFRGTDEGGITFTFLAAMEGQKISGSHVNITVTVK